MENHFIYSLEKTKGIGFVTIKRILEISKNFDEFLVKKEKILNIPKMNLNKFEKICKNKNSDFFKKYIKTLNKMSISLVNYKEEDFPNKLDDIPSSPYSLHFKGSKKILDNKIVGIVGSRNSTSYGNKAAFKIAKFLSKKGYTVISGLADGIDTYAHKGALEGKGSTIAVIGSGLDCIYPKKNTKLFLEIEKKGLIISEFYLGTKPYSYNFPRRNRIISGLSDFLIVIEATLQSGSLITVNHAIEQGKDVWALPGEIFSKSSIGTNMLIRDGAYPLISTSDLSEYLENNISF